MVHSTDIRDVGQWYTARIFHNLEKPRVDNPSRRQKNWSPVALSDDVTHNIFNSVVAARLLDRNILSTACCIVPSIVISGGILVCFHF